MYLLPLPPWQLLLLKVKQKNRTSHSNAHTSTICCIFREQNDHLNSVLRVVQVQICCKSHIKGKFFVYFPHEPHTGKERRTSIELKLMVFV